MRTYEQTVVAQEPRAGSITLQGRIRERKVLLLLLLGVALAGALGAGSRWKPYHVTAAGAVGTESCTWYVDWEAIGANNGSSWDDAFIDLQLALDAASTGDEIWVAEGIYRPSAEHGGSGPRLQSFQMLNGVGIYGGFDPSVGDVGWEDRDWVANETVLSGNIGAPDSRYDNSYHVFYHDVALGLGQTAILDGFTISEGYADGGEEHDYGGGMYNASASPTLANCVFASNEAYDRGGGLYNGNSAPSASNCAFRNNIAGFDGGGMHNEASSPTVEDSAFIDNLAWGMGGGVSNHDSSPTFLDCVFSENVADQFGGGMMNWGGAPTLLNCSFWDNEAGPEDWAYGGGLYNYDSSPVITNCLFASNDATVTGGAIYSHGGLPIVTNCTFHGNSAGEEGGAIYHDSGDTLAVYNSILWGDSPEEVSGEPVQVTYSDVQGGYPGEGNISSNPRWRDPGDDDYHLRTDSPCIDVGTNDAPELPDSDFEGDPRIIDGDDDGTATVDMGIDESTGLEPITGLEASNDSPTALGSETTLLATVETGTEITYEWALGDGSFDSGEAVIHIYPAVGIYTAVVTATNPVSQDSASTLVTITPVTRPVHLPLILKDD